MSLRKIHPLFLFLFPVGNACEALPLRAAYQYSFGKAWSAAAELPQYDILDLGPGTVPLAVNDGGTVLLADSANRLVRWTWGRREVLLEDFIPGMGAHLNEAGTVVTLGVSGGVIPSVFLNYWLPAQTDPSIQEFGANLVGDPHSGRIHDLNDRDEVIARVDAQDNWEFLPPQTIQIRTEIGSIGSGSWSTLATYEYFEDIDFTLTQGGTLYEVTDLNNYGDTVGQVYMDQATSSAWEPEPVYLYQDQYSAFNLNTVLDFVPLQVNDARHLLGRTQGPVHQLVILDRFGERCLGGLVPELAEATPAMSNPVNGLEEIVLMGRYWKRMTERDLLGRPTGNPSPDFREAAVADLVANPGTWTELEATCISANGRLAGTGRVFNEDTVTMEQHAFLLAGRCLLPDWDRNGKIDTEDRQFSHAGEPWRFWVNDDDDEGGLARSALDDLPGSPEPDWETEGVDGLRDVVDFFPVHVDLQRQLRAIGDPGSVELVLRHGRGALNFTYTSLLPEEVGRLRDGPLADGFGPAFDEPLQSAATQQVTEEGVLLSPVFLGNILSDNRGILLLEARGPTTSPLVLELRRDGQPVLTSSLPLSIANVADMLRIINLRNADPKFSIADPGPWMTRAGEPPNLPDSFLESFTIPLRTLIHVHGYNWTGEEAPAAHAELFKRFFQCGSNARFVGVSWFGDQGMLELTGSSFDYNENVINSFITAKTMTDALAPFSGPGTYLFAHSLGNMVASSAVFDHGLQAAAYFMTNAAVPVEAYIGETADRRLMVHPDWKDEGTALPDYPEHLLSPNWYRLFPPEDHRSGLGWKSRFENLDNQVACYHFYSSGEDVLRSGTGDIPGLFSDVGHREQVWVYNEMVKGTGALGSSLTGDVHGGWGFNRQWMEWVEINGSIHPPSGTWIPLSTQEAAAIDPSALVAEPFFAPFSDGDADFPAWGDGTWLYGDRTEANAHLPSVPFGDSSILLVKNHAKILAEGIPAHSAPAGSNPLPNLLLLRNIDLDQAFRNSAHWPFRDDADKRDRWLHSDYLNPALSHVAGLYLKIVNIINQIP